MCRICLSRFIFFPPSRPEELFGQARLFFATGAPSYSCSRCGCPLFAHCVGAVVGGPRWPVEVNAGGWAQWLTLPTTALYLLPKQCVCPPRLGKVIGRGLQPLYLPCSHECCSWLLHDMRRATSGSSVLLTEKAELCSLASQPQHPLVTRAVSFLSEVKTTQMRNADSHDNAGHRAGTISAVAACLEERRRSLPLGLGFGV